MTEILSEAARSARSMTEILEPFVLKAQQAESDTRLRANRARDEVARLSRLLADAEKERDEAVRASDEAQRFLLQVWETFRDSAT